MSRRSVDGEGAFSWAKDRDICTRSGVKETRRLWAELTNRMLEREGFEERITEKSFVDLGVDLDPSSHRGWMADKLANQNIVSRLVVENEEVAFRNRERLIQNPEIILDELTVYNDIAFIFLSESLNLTAEEKEKLLKLHILPHSISDSIQVIGYPSGSDYMQKTTGQTEKDQPDVMQVVYHNANTEPGSSGSPIIVKSRSLIGVHTRAPDFGGEHNRGVRIRLDLMPFLDQSLATHQSFLADSEGFIEKHEQEKKAAKQKEIADIEARGEARGEVRGEARGIEKEKRQTALALMEDGDGDAKIARITGLPLEDIAALRKSR